MLAAALLFTGGSATENDVEGEQRWSYENSELLRVVDKCLDKLDKGEKGDDEDFLCSYGVSVPHKSDYKDNDSRKGRGKKRSAKKHAVSRAKSYSEFGYNVDDHDPGHEDYDGK